MNRRSENTPRKPPANRFGPRLAAALLVLALLLAACGQRGPLYLPDEAPAPATPNENTGAGQAEEEEDADGARTEADAGRR